MANLNLKKFDISVIKPNKSVVIIGKRNRGKSYLVKDLLYNNKDILPIGSAISITECANEFYSKIIPPMLVYDEYSDNIVDNIVYRQKKIKEKIDMEIDKNNYSNLNPNTFLIMDGLMDSAKQWVKSNNMKTCFINSRLLNLLLIITIQYPLGIPPELRTNIDYIFIFRENIISNRKRLYEHYANIFTTFDIFCQVMDNCTGEDYQCLVIDNSSKSNKIEDKVFWYKAETHNPFKIGSKELWNYNNENYDTNIFGQI